jgi:CRP-like cAMP-binding protein
MTVRQDPVFQRLRRFRPLSSLPEAALEHLVATVPPTRVPAGELLFRRGDSDGDTLFLVAGRVRLAMRDGTTRILDAAEDAARWPLDPVQPRSCDCQALEPVELLRVSPAMMESLEHWGWSADAYAVGEVTVGTASGDDPEIDWMLALLQAPLFHEIPPHSLFDLLQLLEPERVRAGDVLIRQGDPADFYYVVCAGRAEVLLQERPDAPPVQIAQKGPGEGFGEEALLSGAPRNATVRMLSDGVVRRLGAADFDALLKQSVVVHLTPADAVARVQGGNGVWLDVRDPEKSARDHVDGATNLPLQGLRAAARTLPRDRTYVVLGEDDRHSAVAVYLLREKGLDAWRLDGGIEALRAQRGANRGD